MKNKRFLFGSLIAASMTLGLFATVFASKNSVEEVGAITAAEVTIDGKNFETGGSNYYVNGDSEDAFTGTAENYNAKWDASSTTLTLKNYVGDTVYIESDNDVNVVLEGQNTIAAGQISTKGLASYGGLVIKGSGSLAISVTQTEGTFECCGIEAEYVTIQESAHVSIDMSGAAQGIEKGIDAISSFIIAGSASLDIDLVAHSAQGYVTYGIYNKGGSMSFNSSGEVNINCESYNGLGNAAIYNYADDASDSFNGDIEFSCSGKVTLERSGTGGFVGVYSAQNSPKNSDGVISFEGAETEVEINGFSYGVRNHSDKRASDDCDISIENGAKVKINSSYEDCAYGLYSRFNGILVSDADYEYTGTYYPVHCVNSSLYGFDIIGTSHVDIHTSEYIHTSDNSISSVDLSGSGYFNYTNLDGSGGPSYSGTYHILMGNNTRILNYGYVRRITDGSPAGTFHLGCYYANNYPVSFGVYRRASAGQVTINGHAFSDTNLYYVNDADDTTSDGASYNAKFDVNDGALFLKNYNGGAITFHSTSQGLLRIVLEQTDSTITADEVGISATGSGNIEITTDNASEKQLTINVTCSTNHAKCIYVQGGNLTTGCNAYVKGHAEITGGNGNAYGADVYGDVVCKNKSVLQLEVRSNNANGEDRALLCEGKFIVDVLSYVNYKDYKFDASGCAGKSYSIYTSDLDFAHFNYVEFKWSGASNCGASNHLDYFENITTGAFNVNNETRIALLESGTAYHIDVINGVDLDDKGSGNFISSTYVDIQAYTIDGLTFAGWTHTGESAISDASAASTDIQLTDNEVVTATYNFISTAPSVQKNELGSQATVDFALSGTPAKVMLVEATGDENDVVVDDFANDSVLDLSVLSSGSYRLCAKYVSTDSHDVYLFSAPFEIGLVWEVTYKAGDGTGSDVVVGAVGSYTLKTFKESGFVAPEGKEFDGWMVSGVKKNSGDSVNITTNTIITASYKDAKATPEPIKPSKGGLSGGAIAGIVVGSVVVVGVGGFSLFWFGIKKKSFGDLVAVFKKK